MYTASAQPLLRNHVIKQRPEIFGEIAQGTAGNTRKQIIPSTGEINVSSFHSDRSYSRYLVRIRRRGFSLNTRIHLKPNYIRIIMLSGRQDKVDPSLCICLYLTNSLRVVTQVHIALHTTQNLLSLKNRCCVVLQIFSLFLFSIIHHDKIRGVSKT